MAKADRARLYVYNLGFLTQKRVRRVLDLAGYEIRLGRPTEADLIGVWGKSPTAHRGEAAAEKHGTDIIRIEDAFLRSLMPGRTGAPPLGLLIDKKGVHFDPAQPSDLETILATEPLDDTALLDRARAGITRLQETHLTKYTAFDADIDAPDPGYVLVVDQTRDDAAVTASKADRNRFLEMLFVAQEENPGAQILIKTHPETKAGLRDGYFEAQDISDRVSFFDEAISPWRLLDGAVGVYTVSSQFGFEAILAGHKPRVFGQPFYAGWGLTSDENPVYRRQRNLTRAQLFAGAMLLYPTWYDPDRDRLCDFETAVEALAAETRAWREDQRGWVASEIRMWKRRHMQQFFGGSRAVAFENDPAKAKAEGRPWMVWASKADDHHTGAVRVEDGFLRSRGLGAELIPPLSLVLDRQGIYYDPSEPSDLESLIRAGSELRPDQARRAERLIAALTSGGLSKYNLGGKAHVLPQGKRILVIGQVEDDASVDLGAGSIRTNEDLVAAARDRHPDDFLIYKPHPDVEAGLRTGPMDAAALADLVAEETDIATLLGQVDCVWTMTSLAGFEALLRGIDVVVTGAPFYAGWGLTEDLGEIPDRRNVQVSLPGLVHATLIDYPRYRDPKTGLPCPVEVIVERLIERDIPKPGPFNRGLSKLQGLFASQSALWR